MVSSHFENIKYQSGGCVENELERENDEDNG